MVFKFSTFDPTEDPPDFDLHSPPASRSSTICLPLNPDGCSFGKAKTSLQGAAGASLRLVNLASKFGCWRPSELLQCPEEGRLKRFTFREMKFATNNFSEENKVGEGGSGWVYKGFLRDGSKVAIKRLNSLTNRELTLHAEVKLGNMIWHRNVVPLHGFYWSSNRGEYMVVYKFLTNGSLGHQLENNLRLDWPARKKIAIGAARGICHLHDLRILHLDIKTANILVDEDFEASIGDFGFVFFMDEYKDKAVPEEEPNGKGTYFISGIMGTRGFMDPERLSGTYSVKSDVYGFGMTLFELISNRPPWETICFEGNELVLPQWAHALLKNDQLERLVDPNMPDGYNKSEVEKIIRLALLCTQFDPKKRPYMAEAVLFLEGIIGLEKRWEVYQANGNPSLDSSSSHFTSCHGEEGLSGPRQSFQERASPDLLVR